MQWHTGAPGWKPHGLTRSQTSILCTAVTAESLTAMPQTQSHPSVIYTQNSVWILDDGEKKKHFSTAIKVPQEACEKNSRLWEGITKIAFAAILCPSWDNWPEFWGWTTQFLPRRITGCFCFCFFFRGHKSSDILNCLERDWDRNVNSISSGLLLWATL